MPRRSTCRLAPAKDFARWLPASPFSDDGPVALRRLYYLTNINGLTTQYYLLAASAPMSEMQISHSADVGVAESSPTGGHVTQAYHFIPALKCAIVLCAAEKAAPPKQRCRRFAAFVRRSVMGRVIADLFGRLIRRERGDRAIIRFTIYFTSRLDDEFRRDFVFLPFYLMPPPPQ